MACKGTGVGKGTTVLSNGRQIFSSPVLARLTQMSMHTGNSTAPKPACVALVLPSFHAGNIAGG